MELGKVIVIKNHMQAEDILNVIQRFPGDRRHGAVRDGEDGYRLPSVNPDADIGLS